MPKRFWLPLAITACLAAADLPEPITPTATIELFNGTDLSGWVPVVNQVEGVFAARDGCIRCLGKPNGYLRTDRSFANYLLTVEWRFIKEGNTGIFCHLTGPDKVWASCFENQGLSRHQGDFALMGGARCAEAPKTAKGIPLVRTTRPCVEKPIGEWNTYTITCRGDTIANAVNGQEMNRITGCTASAGYIAIQSEGTEFEVRRIAVSPLPPPP